jgi:hypothetical protein
MRIRTIKPEFWANENIAKLPDFTILLAIGLLNYADDEGYFNANPALIRAALFPLREDSSSIPVALQDLSKQGFVALYSAGDGRKYGNIVNFLKHQVINKPNKSKIKELCAGVVPIPEDSRSDTVALQVGTGIREQGMDQGTGREVADAPAAEPSVKASRPPSLEDWLAHCKETYPAWPRADAETAWWHYESVGWKRPKGLPIVKWKGCAVTCHKNWESGTFGQRTFGQPVQSYPMPKLAN